MATLPAPSRAAMVNQRKAARAEQRHKARALLAHLLGNEEQEAHHQLAAEQCHERQDHWQAVLHRGGVA